MSLSCTIVYIFRGLGPYTWETDKLEKGSGCGDLGMLESGAPPR